MKNRNGCLIFAVISAAVCLAIGAIVIFLALSGGAAGGIADYTFPAYRDYVDRSASMLFTSSGGAQFFEAEKAELTECGVTDTELASGDSAVELSSSRAAVRFSLIADRETRAALAVRLCYLSEGGRDTEAGNLFSVYLNDVEVGSRHSVIRHCASVFDFRENVLSEVVLRPGANELEIVSRGSACSLDYVVLLPHEERSSEEETVGYRTYDFLRGGGEQRFEAEHGEFSEAAVMVSEEASRSYFLRFDSEDSRVLFHIVSDGEGEVPFAVSLRNLSDILRLRYLLLVEVNGALCTLSETGTEEEGFCFYYGGTLPLTEGENEVSVRAMGDLDLDCLVLNAGVEFSAYRTAQKFEAEAGDSGNSVEEEGSYFSGGRAVTLTGGSSLSFSFLSDSSSEEYLSLFMRAEGVLLEIAVNGEPMDFSGTDTDIYRDIAAGRVHIAAGRNTVRITVREGELSLDYFTLYHASASDAKVEAEGAVFMGGMEEWNERASGGKNLGYLREGSLVKFYIHAERACTVRLSLSLSCIRAGEQRLSDLLSLSVNRQHLDLSRVTFSAGASWTAFEELPLGTCELSPGLNVVAVRLEVADCNLDYLGLAQEGAVM